MGRNLAWCWSSLALGLGAACSPAGPDPYAEAAALEGQGKLEEAAAKLDLACAFRPKSEQCPASGDRAAELRLKVAEQAIATGQYIPAEKLILAAFTTASDSMQAKLTERLAQEDLVQGVRYQRALLMDDKNKVVEALRVIAATRTPAAAKAKEWLDKEQPGMWIAAARAACGPEHQGSCTKAWEELQKSGAKGPEVDEVQALAEAEARRVYPLRVQAESFIAVFAGLGQKQAAFSKCIAQRLEEAGDEAAIYKGQIHSTCRDETLGGNTYDQNKTNENLWRRLMKSMADPEIVAPLNARKATADSTGTFSKQDIPKPKPGSKK